MIVGGIDEAGRGSIIGPLVVAGVAMDDAALKELAELGVKDSKVLTPRRRGLLYPEIRRLSRSMVSFLIGTPEIDRYVSSKVRRRKLNYLEAIYMAKTVDRLNASKTYIDAPDTNPNVFTKELYALLSPESESILVAEHRADSHYVVVSAASIVAKVERDLAVARLRETYGEFGSGYPSDGETISFLREWVKKSDGAKPSFSRATWKSWDRILYGTLVDF